MKKFASSNARVALLTALGILALHAILATAFGTFTQLGEQTGK